MPMTPRRRILIYASALAAAMAGCDTTKLSLTHRRIAGAEGTTIDVLVIKAADSVPPATAPADNPRRTAVVLHPWLVDKNWLRPFGERLARGGWNVVMPDLRNHGQSGGEHVTWGAKEKHDVRLVMDALVAEGLVTPRIYAMGASLGGCVAIQYAAVDPRCRGVLALAPPSGLRGVVERVWPLATEELIDAAAEREAKKGGYTAADASAVRAAAKLRCPLILVRGYLDVVIPYKQLEQIYNAAAGPKKMIALFTTHGGMQKGRDAWLVDRMHELTTMPRPPTASAPRPAPRPRVSVPVGADERRRPVPPRPGPRGQRTPARESQLWAEPLR